MGTMFRECVDSRGEESERRLWSLDNMTRQNYRDLLRGMRDRLLQSKSVGMDDLVVPKGMLRAYAAITAQSAVARMNNPLYRQHVLGNDEDSLLAYAARLTEIVKSMSDSAGIETVVSALDRAVR